MPKASPLNLRRRRSSERSAQEGAALFVALMLLIILSLLAVSAAQVTSLQERMAAAYWADTRLFEGVEARLNRLEAEVTASPVEFCGTDPEIEDPAGVIAAAALDPTQANYSAVESLSRVAETTGSLTAGRALGGVQCVRFRVTVAALDVPGDPTSRSVLQTNYVVRQ